MSIFGLSKLWSWVVIVVGALALIGGAYWLIFERGADSVRNEQAQEQVEQQQTAREADQIATETVIREREIIRNNTIEVKEVIREVPDTGLNPVSRARLERVREQQKLHTSTE